MTFHRPLSLCPFDPFRSVNSLYNFLWSPSDLDTASRSSFFVTSAGQSIFSLCKVFLLPKAMEFKIVRPFGDNGKEAENWSVNLLHPYRGNVSSIGDAYKLLEYQGSAKRAVFVLAYEHGTARIPVEPLLRSFEVIAGSVCHLPLGKRVEETRTDLVHPVHQVLRCVAWELESNS